MAEYVQKRFGSVRGTLPKRVTHRKIGGWNLIHRISLTTGDVDSSLVVPSRILSVMVKRFYRICDSVGSLVANTSANMTGQKVISERSAAPGKALAAITASLPLDQFGVQRFHLSYRFVPR